MPKASFNQVYILNKLECKLDVQSSIQEIRYIISWRNFVGSSHPKQKLIGQPQPQKSFIAMGHWKISACLITSFPRRKK